MGFLDNNGLAHLWSVIKNYFLAKSGGTVTGSVTFMSGNTHYGQDTYNATGGIVNNGELTQNGTATFVNGMTAGGQNTFERVNVVGTASGSVASLFGGNEVLEGDDLNADKYKVPGTWSIPSTDIAQTLHAGIESVPITSAGTLVVRDGDGRGNGITQAYCRRQQIFIPYLSQNYTYVRTIYSSATAQSWNYGKWYCYYGKKYPDFYTNNGTVLSSTSWKQSLSITLPDTGPWMVYAVAATGNSWVRGVMLATIENNIVCPLSVDEVWEQIEKANGASGSSYPLKIWTSAISIEATTIYVYTKYNGAGATDNAVYVYASRM